MHDDGGWRERRRHVLLMPRMFYVRQEADPAPVPDWLCPCWLTVVMMKGRDRARRNEASGRAQGVVWGGTKPDPEERPIFGPCQPFLAASNS